MHIDEFDYNPVSYTHLTDHPTAYHQIVNHQRRTAHQNEIR